MHLIPNICRCVSLCPYFSTVQLIVTKTDMNFVWWKTLQLRTFKFHTNCNACTVDFQFLIFFLFDDAVSNSNYTPPTGRTMDEQWIQKDLEAYYSDSCVKEEGKSRMSFLGEFPLLRKATSSFVMSVRLSTRMESLDSHWTDLHEMWYLRVFRKSVEKIQVSLKSNKNKG